MRVKKNIRNKLVVIKISVEAKCNLEGIWFWFKVLKSLRF